MLIDLIIKRQCILFHLEVKDKGKSESNLPWNEVSGFVLYWLKWQ